LESPIEMAGHPYNSASETRRDVAASETLAESLRLPRLSGTLTSRRDVFRDVW